jgi:hypothetical protein
MDSIGFHNMFSSIMYNAKTALLEHRLLHGCITALPSGCGCETVLEIDEKLQCLRKL